MEGGVTCACLVGYHSAFVKPTNLYTIQPKERLLHPSIEMQEQGNWCVELEKKEKPAVINRILHEPMD